MSPRPQREALPLKTRWMDCEEEHQLMTSGFPCICTYVLMHTSSNTHHTHRRTERKRQTASLVDHACVWRCHLLRRHHGTETESLVCLWGLMVQNGSWTLPLLSDFSLVCYTWVFLKLGTYWELQWSTMGLTRVDCGWLCWPWVVTACRGFEDHRP